MNPENSNQSDSFGVDNADFSATTEGGVIYSETGDSKGAPEVMVVRSETEISHGPLPPPRILREYDSIVKNGAERIMAMAEKEQEARIREREKNGESNRRLAERKLNYFRRGQWMGFILALIVLLSAALFAYYHFEALAGILLATTLVALVGLFVYTTKNQKKD